MLFDDPPKYSDKITKTLRSPLGGTMIAIWDKCKAVGCERAAARESDGLCFLHYGFPKMMDVINDAAFLPIGSLMAMKPICKPNGDG
jgi:hypothetical protein